MILIALIAACLVTLTALSLLAKYTPALRSSVLAYGKLNSTADEPRSRWTKLVKSWTVPKVWFAHFYLVGSLLCGWCWLEIGLVAYNWRGPLMSMLAHDNAVAGDRIPWSTCQLGLALMTLHLCRRLYESWYVEHPSAEATMHVSHYLCGLGFYGGMVLGTWLEGAAALDLWSTPSVDTPSLWHWTTVAALSLFFLASKHQWQCHQILASLRKASKSRYAIPFGDWFQYLVAPHYVCDILIYTSLVLLYRGQSILLLCGLGWTVVNLTITASETKAWYQKTFPHFPAHRSLLIPGVF